MAEAAAGATAEVAGAMVVAGVTGERGVMAEVGGMVAATGALAGDMAGAVRDGAMAIAGVDREGVTATVMVAPCHMATTAGKARTRH